MSNYSFSCVAIGAGLYVYGLVGSIEEGVAQAYKTLATGKAIEKVRGRIGTVLS